MRTRGSQPIGAPLLLAVLLVPAGVFLAVHLRSLDYGFVWTDRSEILDGGLVLAPGELHRSLVEPMVADPSTGRSWAYYRPLQVALVSSIHAAAGESPWAYRLPSLAMGALTMSIFAAWVLWWTARPGAALFAGLLPGLHPAGLEIYVWIAGLSAAMVALFLVVSFACASAWLHCARGRTRTALLSGCAVFYLLALLSKESAVILAPLLLALVLGDALAGRTPRGRSIRLRGVEVSFAGLALVAAVGLVGLVHIGVVRPWVLGSSTSSIAIGGSRATHLLTALASWPGSLGWMAAPLHSNASDLVPIVDRLLDPRPWLGLALLAGSMAGWIALARSGRTTAALGIAWIWIAFLPTANLLPTLHARAERHVFLSTFGLALVLVDLGPAVMARLRAPAALAPALAALLLFGLAQRTWARAPDWKSTVALFASDVSREPDYREGRYWLAAQLLEDGRIAEALEQLEVLLTQLGGIPGRSSYLGGDPGLLYCQGLLLDSDPARAVEFVQELASNRPKRAATAGMQACLAAALEATHRCGEAIVIYERLAAAPRPDPRVLDGLARCQARLGRRPGRRGSLDHPLPMPGPG